MKKSAFLIIILLALVGIIVFVAFFQREVFPSLLTGILTVQTFVDEEPSPPDGNAVYVNDQPYYTNATGYWRGEVQTGNCEVTAKYDGRWKSEATTVYEEQTTSVHVNWETPTYTGSIQLFAHKDGRYVYAVCNITWPDGSWSQVNLSSGDGYVETDAPVGDITVACSIGGEPAKNSPYPFVLRAGETRTITFYW